MKRVFILLLSGILVSVSCAPKGQESATEQSAGKITEVTVGQAVTRMVPQEAEFTGNIEPFVKNNITSAAAQRIEKIFVEVGQRVSRGQLLVQMESVNYTQARLQLENLRVNLSRTEELYKAGGVSKQQYDQLQTQVQVAEESVRNLSENTKLLSPIDGVVTQRLFDNGDMATGMPILVLMQINPVKIMVNISEEFYPQTRVGTPVEITLDVYNGKKYNGKVSLIYPTIDPATHTFQAQVTIPNSSGEIRPGMFARAKVNFGSKERTVVSDRAVVKQTGTNDKYVYVLDGDIVRYTKVEIGKRVGDIYEIKSGLEAGQMVVTAGISRLVDQAKVKVVEGNDMLKQ